LATVTVYSSNSPISAVLFDATFFTNKDALWFGTSGSIGISIFSAGSPLFKLNWPAYDHLKSTALSAGKLGYTDVSLLKV
jgi:hypothetical protein